MGLAMSESCLLWWNYLNLNYVERLEVAQVLEELQEKLR
jgi:hypothetical protein